jgi:predicted Zn finger-like uncharacterized protein
MSDTPLAPIPAGNAAIPCPKCRQGFRVNNEAIAANARVDCQNRSCGNRFMPLSTSAGQGALKAIRIWQRAHEAAVLRKNAAVVRKNAPVEPFNESDGTDLAP